MSKSTELIYELRWDDHPGDATAETATWGSLCVRLGDSVVWGSAVDPKSGAHWTWIDLLEHLAEIWPWLLWEELTTAAAGTTDAKALLSERSLPDFLSATQRPLYEEALFQFRHRHDLSMAIQGKLLPQLWVVRDGRSAWVMSPAQSVRLDIDTVLATLTRLGDEIVGRLATVHDERAEGARALWATRLDIDVTKAAAICVGLTSKGLDALAGGNVTDLFEIDSSTTAATFEPNELLAAARMSVPRTAPTVVRTIVEKMRSVPKGDTRRIDDLAAIAADIVDPSRRPHVQGEQLARWLREYLKYSPEHRIEPAEILKELGVHVDEFDANDDGIDAVACWGPHHGPAILINLLGRHVEQRRTTLAHELIHLILDRKGALPLAEVLGGNVSLPVEQRARAFAPELLLPQEVAGREFAMSGQTPKLVAAKLAFKFGVSQEIVAWQAYNSGHQLDWDTFTYLRDQVTYPSRFIWHSH